MTKPAKRKPKRVPVVYKAAEIVDWHVAEEYEPGKWRPARCLGFGSLLSHIGMRLRITWRVFIGRYDALDWGAISGEPKDRQYADVTEPRFFSSTRVYSPKREAGR